MAYSLTRRALTVSALALASTSLSACSFLGFGHGNSYAGANCNLASAQACASQSGNYDGRYGAALSGAYQQHGMYGAAQYTGAKTRYGTSTQFTGYQEQIYAQQQYAYQQQMMLRAAPVPSYSYQTTSYQAPASNPVNVEMYTPSTSTTSYTSQPANCPAGTTAQSDGTCLQGSTTSYSSLITSTPSYSSTSSYSGGYITGGETANCPAGTSASSDGSCLMGGATSSYSSPSYSTGSTTSSGVAPAISTYDWGSNDTAWGSDSYVSPGTRNVDAPNSYPSVDISTQPAYQPFRK